MWLALRDGWSSHPYNPPTKGLQKSRNSTKIEELYIPELKQSKPIIIIIIITIILLPVGDQTVHQLLFVDGQALNVSIVKQNM